MDPAQVVLIVIGLANVLLLAALVWKIHNLQASIPPGFGPKVLRSLRKLKAEEWGFALPAPHHDGIDRPVRHHPHDEWASRSRAIEYFVFWQWKDGAWKHRSETLPRGAQPGPQPVHAGAFDGQVLKTWMGRKR
jgi:hypothetical protein